MADDQQDQDKTEPASPKKREDARKKGQVARSGEIPSVAILLCALSVFYFAGGWMLNLRFCPFRGRVHVPAAAGIPLRYAAGTVPAGR